MYLQGHGLDKSKSLECQQRFHSNKKNQKKNNINIIVTSNKKINLQ
jgi:hypothetical protein